MKIKKGDNIIVIAGKDKGKKGKIVRVIPKKGKVVVEGINMVKRRRRPKKEGQKGQVVSVAMPLDNSNVMLISGKAGKGTRIRYKIENDKKIRIAKKDGSII